MVKPPVLLFHGLTGAPAELQAVSRALRRAGYEVETPMLPGHGADEKALLKTGWKDWLGSAEEELIRLSDAEGAVRLLVAAARLFPAKILRGSLRAQLEKRHECARIDL